MRTRNEKFLLVILAVVIFVGVNFFGYRWLTQKQAALTLSEKEMKADQAEAQIDLQQSDKWAQRKQWIHDHQPAMGDEGETKAAVLEYVLKGARDNKLEIQEQNLNDTQRGPAGTRINVTVKVKGSMQDMVKWLTDIEKPDQFYAVSTFSLKADQDQKSMVCSVQIARYFKEGTP
jgi:Tfp pilus assembly protein PilO